MRLGYVIVYVADVTATVGFYERAFGLARRFIHESGQYAEIETGATTLAFAGEGFVGSNGHAFRANRPGQEPAGAEIAFVVEDVATAYRRALDAGAVGRDSPQQKPWGQTVAYVRDLNGFVVELCTAMGD
jgi:lactoylglutathione lyase